VIIFIGLNLQATAQDIKITDYDVPVSRSHELYVTGDLIREDVEYSRDYDYYDESFGDIYESYGLRATWQNFYNSPYYAWSVSAGSQLAFFDNHRQKSKFKETAGASGSIRRYTDGRGLFFGAAGFSSYWRHSYFRPIVDANASIGLGRTVEATVLARAIRINEFLVNEKILEQHLTKETLLALAAIIDREREYKMRYGETYAVWWYADMDRLIADAASLTGGSVGPIGLFRIREVLNQEQVQRRAYGWTVETGISAAVARPYTSNLGDPDVFISGIYAFPIGLKQQCVAEARADTKTGKTFEDFYHFKASLKYIYELSNQIDLTLGESFLKEREAHIVCCRQSYQRGGYQNRIEITTSYYLENSISLEVDGDLAHTLIWYNNPGYRVVRSRDWGVAMSVAYHVF
jgi:hypothetical protein